MNAVGTYIVENVVEVISLPIFVRSGWNSGMYRQW